MLAKKLKKIVCCSLDVTIGSRLIGFIGIVISVVLITVLLNDKHNEDENYDISRKTALAFGLDWEHFHSDASTHHQKDPKGKMISIIVIFYSCAFLIINLFLVFATLWGDWICAIPWLVCECFGCLSKFGALIYHFFYRPENVNDIFVIGSIVYIVTTIWWWTVVLLAVLSWKSKTISELKLELTDLSSRSRESVDDDVEVLSGKIRYFQDPVRETENLDSPGPYHPNTMYALI